MKAVLVALAVVGGLLLTWFWAYVAARLMSAGILRTWLEYIRGKKGKEDE
uniref:Uncharacterized protein n=1 Tax=viral metagenome TaxID=1070528 RepID=A0A6M3ILH3_9ZZZZ